MGKSAKIGFGRNFWLEGPIDLRKTRLNYILQDLFRDRDRDTPLFKTQALTFFKLLAQKWRSWVHSCPLFYSQGHKKRGKYISHTFPLLLFTNTIMKRNLTLWFTWRKGLKSFTFMWIIKLVKNVKLYLHIQQVNILYYLGKKPSVNKFIFLVLIAG